MKKLLKKDKFNRKNFYNNENLTFVLKNILKNNKLFKYIRWNASLYFTTLKYNYKKIYFKNRCVISNRNNISSDKLKFSRLILLKLIRNGYIYGIRKIC